MWSSTASLPPPVYGSRCDSRGWAVNSFTRCWRVCLGSADQHLLGEGGCRCVEPFGDRSLRSDGLISVGASFGGLHGHRDACLFEPSGVFDVLVPEDVEVADADPCRRKAGSESINPPVAPT